MTDIATRLQTLSDLHRDGHLTQEEFASQKAGTLHAGLNGGAADRHDAAGRYDEVGDRYDEVGERYDEDRDLSGAWQDRFAFFDTHGSPASRDGKQALKAASWGQRFHLGANWWAFFFGVFYLMVLGLWKRAVAILALSIVGVVVLNAVGAPGMANGFGFGIAALNMWTTNYAYYRKRRTGRDSWNIAS